jgi:hypothetical protein
VVRYAHKGSGGLIHLDIKKLGRFERVGHRITWDRTGQSNGRGVGWDHVHVCIDDASRIAVTGTRGSNTLGGLTPDEEICKDVTAELGCFILDPIHHLPGLNTHNPAGTIRFSRQSGAKVPSLPPKATGLRAVLWSLHHKLPEVLLHRVSVFSGPKHLQTRSDHPNICFYA